MIEFNSTIDHYFPPEAPVVILHAHPDDETFLTAGLITTLCERKRDLLLIYTAAGIVANQPQTLVRVAEATSACRLLGSFAVEYLKYCEPQLSQFGGRPFVQQPVESIAQDLVTIIDAHFGKPCIILSYDKHGGYGNCDHMVLHHAGRYLKEAYPEIVLGFFEVTIHREGMSDWLTRARRNLCENDIPKLSYWSKVFGLSTSEITHYLVLSVKQLTLKRAALAQHTSQIKKDEFPLSLSESDFRAVFGLEFFACLQDSRLNDKGMVIE